MTFNCIVIGGNISVYRCMKISHIIIINTILQFKGYMLFLAEVCDASAIILYLRSPSTPLRMQLDLSGANSCQSVYNYQLKRCVNINIHTSFKLIIIHALTFTGT